MIFGVLDRLATVQTVLALVQAVPALSQLFLVANYPIPLLNCPRRVLYNADRMYNNVATSMIAV